MNDRRRTVTRRRHDRRPQDQQALWILGGMIALFFVLWILFAPGRGYVHYLQLKREEARLVEENHDLEVKNAELAEDLKRLESDDAYLEKIARQKHGLLKKDESVYEFNSRKRNR